MDALSFTTQSATSGQAACSAHQPKEGRLEYGETMMLSDCPLPLHGRSEAVANNGGTNTTQAASTVAPHRAISRACPSRSSSTSPLNSSPGLDLYFVGNLEARPFSFPCQHCSPPYSALPLTRSDCPRSSLSPPPLAPFRHTLMPLVWHTIVIRTRNICHASAPAQELRHALIRSTSPQRSRRSSSPYPITLVSTPPPLHPWDGRLHTDKYIDLDQSFLLTLLRSMHLSYTHQLEYLYWSAEAVPNPPSAAGRASLRSLEVDGRTFYHGHQVWRLERLESLKMVRYESTLLPIGARVVFEAQAGGVAGVIGELPEGWRLRRCESRSGSS